MELIRITKKDMADGMAFLGVAPILGVVAFATPNDIPVGEMAYQKLWLGRLAMVFAACCVLSLCLDRKQYLSFSSIVTWVLIALGGMEAVWGLRQVYGLSASNHSLYALTGSFYNPGPYSGYLAMIVPLCLNEWLDVKKKIKRTWVEQVKYYVAFGVLLLILCVLPAGMSRSAWISAAISGIWVYGMHEGWGKRLKEIGQKHKKKVLFICMAVIMILIVLGYALFQLKAASASGRLFMWKISCMVVADSPLTGHGAKSFASAYGTAQEEYFSGGSYSETEELVAGSPEYAFNEYLQVVVEYGLPVLLVVLLVIGFCLWKGVKEKRIGVCGGVIAFLVFAFSSYPMQISAFAIAFFFLLAACVIGRSKVMLLLFTSLIALAGIYYWKNNEYEACKKWTSAKMLYNIGAYSSAKEDYVELYPELKNRGAFLFEYGHCLHKLKEYESSTRILTEAMEYSCDPMILNVIGKNYQALKMYEKAEKYLIRSTHRLPGRIYPYYLLAKLYAEPEYRQEKKLKQVVGIVLTKEPKVQSTAIKEMRENLNNLIIQKKEVKQR